MGCVFFAKCHYQKVCLYLIVLLFIHLPHAFSSTVEPLLLILPIHLTKFARSILSHFKNLFVIIAILLSVKLPQTLLTGYWSNALPQQLTATTSVTFKCYESCKNPIMHLTCPITSPHACSPLPVNSRNCIKRKYYSSRFSGPGSYYLIPEYSLLAQLYVGDSTVATCIVWFEPCFFFLCHQNCF